MNPKMRLLELLQSFEPADDKERADKTRMIEFVKSLGQPLSRTELQAHFTGSAVVIHPSHEQVCLNFHGKLQRWMQVGGHSEEADGGDIAATALREAREETGLEVEHFGGSPYLFDIDIHTIPARTTEPEHLHLDLRFLLLAKTETIILDPNESGDVRWFPWNEALSLLSADPGCQRLFKKAQQLAKVASP
ncbi:NUDIX domain-containing protein [Patescibacteria group bacterium]|nr:NUDIX domain-containing protein [Patescibacteria group bacterium]